MGMGFPSGPGRTCKAVGASLQPSMLRKRSRGQGWLRGVA